MPSFTPPNRPSWDDVWLAIAQDIAQRSLCDRERVGAVIADRENRIVVVGYNGPPAGFQHGNVGCSSWCERAMYADIRDPQPGYTDCPSLHAEANALMVCDRKDREGGTIYVTGGVCWDCAKLIANSGLAYVMVNPSAPAATHRNSEKSYRFLEQCGITVVTG